MCFTFTLDGDWKGWIRTVIRRVRTLMHDGDWKGWILMEIGRIRASMLVVAEGMQLLDVDWKGRRCWTELRRDVVAGRGCSCWMGIGRDVDWKGRRCWKGMQLLNGDWKGRRCWQRMQLLDVDWKGCHC